MGGRSWCLAKRTVFNETHGPPPVNGWLDQLIVRGYIELGGDTNGVVESQFTR